MGLVSRVSPVQTALRNCTRDEGRSVDVGRRLLLRRRPAAAVLNGPPLQHLRQAHAGNRAACAARAWQAASSILPALPRHTATIVQLHEERLHSFLD
jgi:hypothetical protein